MKHLKTYEGLFDFFRKKKVESPIEESGDILYELITIPEMVEYEENHKTVEFTKNEIDYLTTLYVNVEYRRKKRNEYVVDHLYISRRDKDVYLSKYDDEWFLVTTNDRNIKTPQTWYNTHKYFKCDTFDGVNQLLNSFYS